MNRGIPFFVCRLRTFWRWLNQPTSALPLDIFRVLIGVIELAFFLSLFHEALDFSAPDGLIDHQLSNELFPFTRYSLIPAGASATLLQILFLIGCLCSSALTLGYRPKLASAIAYGILVSTYRRNFLVMYVDDSIAHLMFFWMLLFPIGRTLSLTGWLAHRGDAWQRWKRAMVPGGAIRCFVWNVGLLYAVAGLWKWTSPMWRDGTAVFAVFKMPVAYHSEFWGLEHFIILVTLNYLTLLMEPLFALTTLWPTGHPVKYGLALALVGFHLIMLATLRIPFANLACLAAAVVLLRNEISNGFGATAEQPLIQLERRSAALPAVALAFTVVLTATMLSEGAALEWRGPTMDAGISSRDCAAQGAATGCDLPIQGVVSPDAGVFERLHPILLKLLWSAGIAQEYQLFNWIDHRNFRLDYEIWELKSNSAPDRVEPSAMFPDNIRGILLQSYLHGVTWTSVPEERLIILKESISTRLAQRYCRRYQPHGLIAVYSSLQRIDPRHPKNEIEHRRLLLTFGCTGMKPILDASPFRRR